MISFTEIRLVFLFLTEISCSYVCSMTECFTLNYHDGFHIHHCIVYENWACLLSPFIENNFVYCPVFFRTKNDGTSNKHAHKYTLHLSLHDYEWTVNMERRPSSFMPQINWINSRTLKQDKLVSIETFRVLLEDALYKDCTCFLWRPYLFA